MLPVPINVAKVLENLKERALRLQANGRERMQAQKLNLKGAKLPRLPDLRDKAANLKLPDIKLPPLKFPDAAAGLERLKAATAEAARQVTRARENMPRSLGDVAPKAKDMAKRFADAVPKRAPVALSPPTTDKAEPAVPALKPRAIPRDAAVPRTRRVATDQAPILIRILPLLLALVAGGVIHILATFAVPLVGAGSAWNRLARLVPAANRMTVLAPQSPTSQPLPFLAPDMRYAICRYDLTIGPVLVSATLPDAGWSLTLYSPQGDNFYAVPAQELRQTELSFQIIAASDRLVQLSPGVRKADVDLSQVTSPGREGLVVVRAPIKGVAHQAEAERILRTASCQQTRPN